MNPKTRRLFFYSLIAVFVLLGAYLLVTAQGWVLDLKNLRIVKTGALFLKYSPSDATIEINGAVSNVSPGLFSTGVFISRLAPGEYGVKLNRAGYLPWEKKLNVSESFVTAASQIKLWPEKFALTPVASSSIKDFWLTDRGAVLQLKSGGLRWAGRSLRGDEVELSDPNSGLIITGDGRDYFLTDLSAPEIVTNLSNVVGPSALKFFPHPFSAGKILAVTKSSLYSFDAARDILEKLSSATGTVGAAASNGEVFLKSKDGNVLIFNLLLRTENSYSLKLPQDSGIRTTPSGSMVFILKNNGDLSVYDRSLDKTTALEKNVSNFFVSPDEKRIALALKNDTLSVAALDDYYGDTQVKKGEEWKISPVNGPISDFAWLSDYPNYGLILVNGNLLLTELDSRTPQNTSPVSGDVKRFLVRGNDLYILKTNGALLETSLR